MSAFIKRMIVVVGMASVFYVSDLRAAYATSCEEINTLEKEFINSDVVFAGIYQGIEQNKASFSVSEMYKAPNVNYFANETVQLHTGAGASKEGAGREFIVFASFNSSGLLVRNDCGLTHEAAGSKITHIKQQEKGSASEREGDVVKLIFTAKITSLQKSQGAMDSWNYAQRGKSSAIVGFSLLEFLRNQSLNPHLENIENIEFYADNCNDELQIGHSYLVHAEQTRIKRGELGYKLFCSANMLVDLQEKDTLLELGKRTRSQKE